MVDLPMQNPSSTYSYLWCYMEVQVSGCSFSDLHTHHDGSCQGGRNSAVCPKHQHSIQSGFKIHPSVSQKAENKGKKRKISRCIKYNKSTIRNHSIIEKIISSLMDPKRLLFNQKLVFKRVDFLKPVNYIILYLVIFLKILITKQHTTTLNQDPTFSSKRELPLLDKSFTWSFRMQVGNSKFNLIHNVWTTKGNHFKFIGALFSSINNKWKFQVLHLGLSLFAWNYKGCLLAEPILNILTEHQLQNKIQSVSNSNTMAERMHNKLKNLEGFQPWSRLIMCKIQSRGMIYGEILSLLEFLRNIEMSKIKAMVIKSAVCLVNGMIACERYCDIYLQAEKGTLDLEWNYQTMHIDSGSTKTQETFPGNFPYLPMMVRIEEANEEDNANKENSKEESVAILEDKDESDDDINSDDPDINEPEMAEEDDELDAEKDEPVKTSPKKIEKSSQFFFLETILIVCEWRQDFDQHAKRNNLRN
ncbi:hypothetical protein VP01_4691g1 [Puccinia sorghi]|uniref:Uncharacterized protein n=1 Tax=Puccinia sorghi TaxID=27349 RepID=A0A0L6UQ26_9BASI|nr:hypothetical protein VP01_4691g1 [Puccinia sorghi]